MLQEKILVGSSKTAAIFMTFINVSGRVYGVGRMDTNWAFRQAYAQSLTVIHRLLTSFLIDMTQRAKSKKSKMRTVMLPLLGNGQD
jgi:hypothetical protein